MTKVEEQRRASPDSALLLDSSPSLCLRHTASEQSRNALVHAALDSCSIKLKAKERRRGCRLEAALYEAGSIIHAYLRPPMHTETLKA